jgi:hypothetical protein
MSDWSIEHFHFDRKELPLLVDTTRWTYLIPLKHVSKAIGLNWEVQLAGFEKNGDVAPETLSLPHEEGVLQDVLCLTPEQFSLWAKNASVEGGTTSAADDLDYYREHFVDQANFQVDWLVMSERTPNWEKIHADLARHEAELAKIGEDKNAWEARLSTLNLGTKEHT